MDGLQSVDPAMAPKSSRKGKALQKLPFNDDAIQSVPQMLGKNDGNGWVLYFIVRNCSVWQCSGSFIVARIQFFSASSDLVLA